MRDQNNVIFEGIWKYIKRIVLFLTELQTSLAICVGLVAMLCLLEPSFPGLFPKGDVTTNSKLLIMYSVDFLIEGLVLTCICLRWIVSAPGEKRSNFWDAWFNLANWIFNFNEVGKKPEFKVAVSAVCFQILFSTVVSVAAVLLNLISSSLGFISQIAAVFGPVYVLTSSRQLQRISRASVGRAEF